MSYPPTISPTNGLGPLPFWSVVMPTYRPDARYFRKALESILQQAPGPEEMHIELVDDCSPSMAIPALLKAVAGDRVHFSQTPKNLGLAGCWNACIERSRGRWVHILHQDDYVLPGFYRRLAEAAERHPDVGLLATRSFFVDEEDVVRWITPRLRDLENGGRKVDGFFYETPIQCPGVVVKRSVYETYGGFRSDLAFTLDREMWARVIGSTGGLVTSEVLSCYRQSDTGETRRLSRTAEDLNDYKRLNRLFADRYPEFDPDRAMRIVCKVALDQASHFSKKGDFEAEKANLVFWKRNTPATLRMLHFVDKVARGVFR